MLRFISARSISKFPMATEQLTTIRFCTLCVVWALAMMGSGETAAAAAEKPNVPFIAVDDLRPKLAQPASLEDETETSFETVSAGKFETVETKVGTWTRRQGTVLIDNQHAKTGRQCLQLAGDPAVVELELADPIDTDGQLTFSAERWTRRDPFGFRIEKNSDGKWSEIYNGDKTIKVGRAFLANIVVPLGDDNITRLRFSVTSPPATGILIDDLRLAPARPQKIISAGIVPMTLPALAGTKASPLLKLKIATQGILNPISLTNLVTSVAGSTDANDIEAVHVFYGGSDSNFKTATQLAMPFGKSATPIKSTQDDLEFDGKQILAEGDNYFWITATLSENANIVHRVGALLKEIKTSDGNSIQFDDQASAQPSLQRMGVAVRNGGDDGVHSYRIPGLATTKDGTLIGVYDVRRTGGGDLPGDIDVGMSRSTDGGRTWESMNVIMDMGDDPKFNHDGIGDPTVMVDQITGTIWVAAIWSHGNRGWNGSGPGLEPAETGQFMLVKSDDDGVTWSKPINITKQVKQPQWSFLLQGPGKGITMADGTIVLPAQYQDPPNATDKRAHRLPHSTFIYSRDHGQTWNIATGAYNDTTESQVCELTDGELMINCRYNREGKRVVMTTRDLGKTWQEHPTNRKALTEPGSCMASLINVGRELRGPSFRSVDEKIAEDDPPAKFDIDHLLLFSNPDSQTGRNHMTIKASIDLGMTWNVGQKLLLDEQGSAGYSCMSMVDRDTVGILYEGSQAHMTFQRIPLKDILNSNDKSDASTSAVKPKAISPDSATHTTAGPLSFARVFGDQMVLQANQPIRVWGTATPGSRVSVSLTDTVNLANASESGNDLTPETATVEVTTAPSGKWLVTLPKRKTSSAPVELSATVGNDTVSLKNILIGEVWFCAGQSNMEWPLAQSDAATEALALANDPQLRLMNFTGAARGGSNVYSPAMTERLKPEKFSTGQWKISDPKSAATFSAVGYYFAQRLRQELDCPVGIINVSIGGTPIEAWVSTASLQSDKGLANMASGNWLENSALDPWCKQRARLNLSRGLTGEIEMPQDNFGPNHSFKPGFMFEAGVQPFLPMSLAGVLWYQGESNGDSRQRIEQYDQAFPLLVNSWRIGFQSEILPVAFVQLPAMGRPNWPLFREFQRRSLASLENVGMAITIDTGHPTNVHPSSKQPVGNRLAQWALVNCYGVSGPAMGPLFHSVQRDSSESQTLSVQFDSVGAGLQASDELPLRHFELAGATGKFFPAVAVLKGTDTVVVSCESVPQPVSVRYAWAPFPKPAVNLTNSAGFPASPFTSEASF